MDAAFSGGHQQPREQLCGRSFVRGQGAFTRVGSLRRCGCDGPQFGRQYVADMVHEGSWSLVDPVDHRSPGLGPRACPGVPAAGTQSRRRPALPGRFELSAWHRAIRLADDPYRWGSHCWPSVFLVVAAFIATRTSPTRGGPDQGVLVLQPQPEIRAGVAA